jgi:hypothetical protein
MPTNGAEEGNMPHAGDVPNVARTQEDADNHWADGNHPEDPRRSKHSGL